MYLKSKDVKVYPSAYRGKVEESGVIKLFDPESRLPDEYNIRNQASQLVSYKDGFIVYPKFEDLDTWDEKKLIFNLHGYRFELTEEAITELLAQTGDVYACLKTADKNTAADIQITDYAANSLVPFSGDNTSLDNAEDIDTSEFRGLSFTDSEPTSSADTYYLLLLKNKELNKDAYIKFRSNDILGDIEDGKEFALYEQLKTKRIRAEAGLSLSAGQDLSIDSQNLVINANQTDVHSLVIIDGSTTIYSTLDVNAALTAKNTLTVFDKATFESTAEFGTTNSNKVTINPAATDGQIKANTVKANNFIGTATDATQAKKLVNNTDIAYNVGNIDTPIYFKNGVPELCDELLPLRTFMHDYELNTSAAKRKEWFTIPKELENKEIRIEVQGCGVNTGKISSNRLLTDWFKISDYLDHSLPILVSSVSKDYSSENNVTGRLVISKRDKDSNGNYKFRASSNRGSGDEANWSKSVFVDKTYTMISTSEGERRWCKAIIYYKANSAVEDDWYSGTDN